MRMARAGRFRGRLLFSALIYAPLVMPEVITGLSMLLLFVAVAVDRGFWTVAIAHTTMAMCFVTVIVQARLFDFDMNLEEAAMDLGASPLETFRAVTLPLILPATEWSAWLDPGVDPEPMLAPPAEALVAGLELRPIGPRVGAVANDDADLLQRVEVSNAAVLL